MCGKVGKTFQRRGLILSGGSGQEADPFELSNLGHRVT